jgi:hypothetical protein
MVSVAEAWALISAEGRSELGWHARRIHLGSACDIRAAVRAPDEAVAVLFEIASRSLLPGAEFPECVGFELCLETIEPGPSGRIRLCLILKDGRYRGVFGTLSDDVATVVAGAATEALGVKLLLGRLHTWERFVSRFGPDRLSDEQQIGLFAELHFLISEVIPVVPSALAAVRAWRGPFMEAQDYRFRAVAVEVKASSAKAPSSFQVSNLDQLDGGAVDALLVYHATIEADASVGSTLPEMVAKARAAVATSDPAASSDLDTSLMEVGYLDIHAASYDRTFRIASVRWFHVEDAFPRLRRASIPAGVTAASYSVSLDSCAPFALDAASARNMIQARL